MFNVENVKVVKAIEYEESKRAAIKLLESLEPGDELRFPPSERENIYHFIELAHQLDITLYQDDLRLMYLKDDLKASETFTVDPFLHSQCESVKGYRIETTVLYEAYRKFCEDRKLTPRSRIAFGRDLNARGYEYVERSTPYTSYRVGLRLKPQD